MLKIDFHVHTRKSDGLNSLDEILKHARRIGLNGVAITDHDIISVKKNVVLEDGFIVIRGIEVSTKQGHIILLDVNEAPRKGLDVREVIDFANETGALVIIPHPFDFLRNGLGKLSWIIPADAVEVINAGCLFDYFNKKAFILAEKRSLPMVAGSDAHALSELGYAYTVIKSAASTPEEIIEAIKKGLTIPIGRRYGIVKKIKRRISKFFHG